MGITNVVMINKPITMETLITENDALASEVAALKACLKNGSSEQRETLSSGQAGWLLDIALAIVAVLQTVAIAVLFW
jgi:hypothetical protein